MWGSRMLASPLCSEIAHSLLTLIRLCVPEKAMAPHSSTLAWKISWTEEPGRCRGAQLASIRKMSKQVSRGSAGEYQADERAGVPRLSWRVSGR